MRLRVFRENRLQCILGPTTSTAVCDAKGFGFSGHGGFGVLGALFSEIRLGLVMDTFRGFNGIVNQHMQHSVWLSVQGVHRCHADHSMSLSPSLSLSLFLLSFA